MGVVEKGNKIYVQANQLTNTEVKVEWALFSTMASRQYYAVPFQNRDQGNDESVLFIQKEYLDALKNKKTSGDDLTIVVDDSFQYGEGENKTKRWIVYHDKKMNAFQWRFGAAMWYKLNSGLANFAGGVLKQYIGLDPRGLGGSMSGSLCDF